jgi:hypothetical protein
MGALKSIAKKVIPVSFFEYYRRLLQLREEILKPHRTVEQVFTDIYEKNLWGGVKGEFSSGAGTTNLQIVSPYVAMVKKMAERESFSGLTFVDLGCGDFRVGGQLLPLCSLYIGVDIVEPLIRRNQGKFGNATTHFWKLNIVNDELPDGDVAFLRQVLQHLSNRQISAVLPKLKKYKWVFITEHYPKDNSNIIPNTDKVHGADVRVYKNSGVYLSEPPFDLPAQALTKVLELTGCGLGEGIDQGVIRTFLYKPDHQTI